MTRQESITLDQVYCQIDQARHRASKCLIERDREGACKAIDDYNVWKGVYVALLRAT